MSQDEIPAQVQNARKYLEERPSDGDVDQDTQYYCNIVANYIFAEEIDVTEFIKHIRNPDIKRKILELLEEAEMTDEYDSDAINNAVENDTAFVRI